MKDGGSAFPGFTVERDGDFFSNCPYEGMTLRDYFAGQALAGIAVNGANRPAVSWDVIAGASYQLADAMLKVRELRKAASGLRRRSDMLSYISAMRQRLGYDKEDASHDEEIEALPAMERVRLIAGWFHGDGTWADQYESYFRSQGLYLSEILERDDEPEYCECDGSEKVHFRFCAICGKPIKEAL